MRIGELARRVGTSTDAVRFYERSGWLPRAARQENRYRDYSEADVDHLRLLIDLRRLDLPLYDAARIASWCHLGHCADATSELPRLIEQRRDDVAERIARLRALDARLEGLARHLGRAEQHLSVIGPGAACCEAADAVIGSDERGCSCCSAAVGASPP